RPQVDRPGEEANFRGKRRRFRCTGCYRAWCVGDLLGFFTGSDDQLLQPAEGLAEVITTLPKLSILALELTDPVVEFAGLPPHLSGRRVCRPLPSAARARRAGPGAPREDPCSALPRA